MAINTVSKESGVEISVTGEYGDVFAECLVTVAHLVREFDNLLPDLSYALVDYINYMASNMIDDETFNEQEFIHAILRIIREKNSNAEELHSEFFEDAKDDQVYGYVLLALKSEFEIEDEE